MAIQMSDKLRNKLAEQGINPETFITNLSRYVGKGEGQAFQNLGQYAQAIQDKQQSGARLDDPETARQFSRLFPTGAADRLNTTTFNYPIGAGIRVPQNVPGANLMQNVLSHQRANPLTIPYAPGTPTQRRREADFAAQQAQEQFAYGQERDKITDERWEREFDYRRQQDAISNALRQAQAAQARNAAVSQIPKEAIYNASLQGAINLTKDLLNVRQPLPQYEGGRAGANFAMQHTPKAVSPEEAVRIVEEKLFEQIAELGLSAKEVESILDIVYKTAGVARDTDWKSLLDQETARREYEGLVNPPSLDEGGSRSILEKIANWFR